MIAVLLSALAWAVPDVPCGTPHFWSPITAELPAGLAPPPNGSDEPDEPEHRDAFGVPNVELSEHFALRWGNGGWVEPAARARLLDALELSWAVQIEDLGHSRPFGTPQTRFNVYIGDTGDNAPPGYGTGGYYSADPEGWPMIVISLSTLGSPEFADITAAHEFYHAVQGATGRFDYNISGPAAWFWEATAVWASAVVFPDEPLYASFLFGYAVFPHRPVNFFRYPSSGAIEEFYQYGAFIWPLFVADRVGSPQVIVEAWEAAHGLRDPLEALRLAVETRGLDLDDLWVQHIAHNVNWDYPDGDLYRRHVASFSYLAEYRNIEAVSLPREGFTSVRSGPADLRPQRYGSNRLTLIGPRPGSYTLTIHGDPEGSSGSPARFGAVVVLDRPSEPSRYERIAFDGVRGEITLDDLDRYSRMSVVIGAWTPELGRFWQTETFGYRYGLDFEPAPEPEVESQGRSCGCATASSPVPPAALLLLALPWVRRRRQARRQAGRERPAAGDIRTG